PSLEVKSARADDALWWVVYRREFLQVADHLIFLELMKYLRREHLERLELVDANQLWDTQGESLAALRERVFSVLNRMEPHFAGAANVFGGLPNFQVIAQEIEEDVREIWRGAS
ncbi:MAG: hypothetical protein NTW86_09985, partial [Candidatus Sumerlaeota bacterium]|nr:hypothetical protein [Candidatus Sumerlaeota bacterium]